MHNTIQRLGIISKHLTSSTEYGRDIAKETKSSLKSYRNKANFDKEILSRVFYGELGHFKDMFEAVITKDPLFDNIGKRELSREDTRAHTIEQMRTIYTEFRKIASEDDYMRNSKLMAVASSALLAYDTSLGVMFGVNFTLYYKTINILGTEKHQPFVDRCLAFQDIGCFSLTELGHGSNVRGILTEALYDSETEEFIINTPNDLGMKFWIGGASKTANMTVVFAQLYTKGKCYGVHAFVVPIRDKRNHMPMPGVVLGDCGKKAGLDGIDNGFLLFKNVRIPRHNLLDKFSTVEKDGTFKSAIEDSDKRFGLSLGALSGGRISLAYASVQTAANALTIAIRFAAIRRQFGKPDEPETPLIEYSLHQTRLFPYVASVFAYKLAATKTLEIWGDNQNTLLDPKNPQLAECHALSSSLKALVSWNTTKAIQESRESCGGLGYSQYNMFGLLREDQDVNQTWEGDNNVLLQQTAKFLIDNLQKLFKGKEIKAPTLSFINLDPANEQKASFKSLKELLDTPKTIKGVFEHRANLLLQKCGMKLAEEMGKKKNAMDTWNELQPGFLNDMAKAYGELVAVQEFAKVIETGVRCPRTQNLLNKLYVLFGVWRISDDLGTFRENDYLSTKQGRIAQEAVISLCRELKDQMVGIMDVIGGPDAILQSPIGHSDGDVPSSL